MQLWDYRRAHGPLSLKVLGFFLLFQRGIGPGKWNFKQRPKVLRDKVGRDFTWNLVFGSSMEYY